MRGADIANSSVTQSAEAWVDLGAHEDVVFFLDVREVSAGTTVKMYYETAPVREQGAFLSMNQGFALAAGVRVDRFFSSNGGVVPARYVRWRMQRTAGVKWDVTFRIWLATYAWRRSA